MLKYNFSVLTYSHYSFQTAQKPTLHVYIRKQGRARDSLSISVGKSQDFQFLWRETPLGNASEESPQENVGGLKSNFGNKNSGGGRSRLLRKHYKGSFGVFWVSLYLKKVVVWTILLDVVGWVFFYQRMAYLCRTKMIKCFGEQLFPVSVLNSYIKLIFM